MERVKEIVREKQGSFVVYNNLSNEEARGWGVCAPVCSPPLYIYVWSVVCIYMCVMGGNILNCVYSLYCGSICCGSFSPNALYIVYSVYNVVCTIPKMQKRGVFCLFWY